MLDLTREQERDLRRFGLKTPKTILDVAFNRGPITNEAMRTYQENVIKLSEEASSELVYLMAMEVEGGECPNCGRPWAMVHVTNKFAEYIYYKPSCKCYPVCPRCKTSMHREMVTGVHPRCLTCAYDPRRPASNRKKKRKSRSERAEEEMDE